ncbi:MAG: DUF308 domain-containing protein [Clostridiales bacterium]|nr:DUF308 domain-containing protein [Clostridiales bacterium]
MNIDENTQKTQSDETEAQFAEGEEIAYSVGAESNEVEGEYISDEEESENEPTAHISSYGDFIIEEFSAEQNAKRLVSVTKIPQTAAIYIMAAVNFVLGVLCVSITGIIAEVLPYIVGAMMIAVGFVQFVVAIIHKEYKEVKTNKTVTFFLVAALGIMIILQEIDSTNDSAIMLVSVIWGVLGLFEGAHAFNHALHRIANSERCAYYLIKGLLECVVAFMLLYRPDSHEIHHFHIIVFGANLIMDAITMLPPVKKLLTNV